jgi:hypothetical protein
MGGFMSSIVVSGDTSGAITISAPAVAGTNTLTLPASTGTVMVTGTDPVFFGYRSAGNVTATTTILHNNVIVNRGSCYNSSTGIFTCPTAGLYEIFASGHSENSQPTVIQIQQNGTSIVSEYSNGSAYPSTTVTAILSCAANDQLKSVIAAGTMWGGDNSGLRMSIKLIG